MIPSTKYELAYSLSEEQKKNFKKVKLGLNDEDLTTIFELTPDELLMFLKQDDVFLQYYTSHRFTLFHEEEMMRLLNKKTSVHVINTAPDFDPLKIDPFIYEQTEGLTFQKKVAQYVDMSHAATSNSQTNPT